MTTTTIPYAYADVLDASLKGNWRVEDLIGDDKPLDFRKPFLPETFARTRPLAFLDDRERLALNQIRGFGYLCTFGLAEEFILPFVLDHARPQVHANDERTRALLQFATEEAKHIDLFRRFRAAFEAGFGSRCETIGPAEAIAKAVLAHEPLAVGLAILQIEWMTQRHYLDSIRDDQGIDTQFQRLLEHHWAASAALRCLACGESSDVPRLHPSERVRASSTGAPASTHPSRPEAQGVRDSELPWAEARRGPRWIEEAQHAKLDTNIVLALAAELTPAQCDAAVDGYLQIGELLDGGLEQQVDLDIASLERATGRTLTDAQREEFRAVQHQAMRWTFLGSGMTHPKFLRTLGEISPEGCRRVESIAAAFC